MKTRIYVYKGIVGIQGGDTFLNDPSAPGQIGCVTTADQVEITREAYELLLKMPKSNDSLGDVDVFAADDGKTIVGWLGTKNRTVVTSKCSGSRDYKPELLEPCVVEHIDVPEEFATFVDNTMDPNRKTRVFIHNNVIGIEVGGKIHAFHPNTWAMVLIQEVEISQAAFEYLRDKVERIENNEGTIRPTAAPTDMFCGQSGGDGEDETVTVFGWLGGGRAALAPQDNPKIADNFDFESLERRIAEFPVPQPFIDFVEGMPLEERAVVTP